MSEALTIARPYAQAAFEYAQENQAVESWDKALARLAELVNHPDLQIVCHSAKVDDATVTSLLGELLTVKQGTPVYHFLGQLVENRRVLVAKQLYQLFKQLENEANKVIDLQLMTAVDLNADQKDDFKKKLEEKFKQKVNMTCHVDEHMLGGAIIRFGDKVIDLSLRSQLRTLAHSLIV